MERKLLDVLQVVTPAETHFVSSGKEYVGVLSYWLIARVQNDDEEDSWIGSFPVVDNGGMTLIEHIQDDQTLVYHWSTFRENLRNLEFYRNEEVVVRDLLEKLYGE